MPTRKPYKPLRWEARTTGRVVRAGAEEQIQRVNVRRQVHKELHTARRRAGSPGARHAVTTSGTPVAPRRRLRRA